MVACTGLDWLYESETRWKQSGGGERGRNVDKNVLVMKCNKNVNIPYSRECLSVNTG